MEEPLRGAVLVGSSTSVGMTLLFVIALVLSLFAFFYSERLGSRWYDIDHIRPGVYEIEAVLEGKKRRTSDKMSIAVADGQAIELDVRLSDDGQRRQDACVPLTGKQAEA